MCRCSFLVTACGAVFLVLGLLRDLGLLFTKIEWALFCFQVNEDFSVAISIIKVGCWRNMKAVLPLYRDKVI